MRALHGTTRLAVSVSMTSSTFDDETTSGDGPRILESGDLPWIFAGRYEVRALLDAGGMGSVYAAVDRELGDGIALKIMRSELLVDVDIVDPQVAELVLRAKHAYHGFWQPHAMSGVVASAVALMMGEWPADVRSITA